MVEGHRQWVNYPNLVDNDSDFEQIGDEFATAGQ